MSYTPQVSVLPNQTTVHNPHTWPLEHVWQLVRQQTPPPPQPEAQTYADQFAHVDRLGSATLRRQYKRYLPGFLPSGTFTQRQADAVTALSGCVLLDYDGLTASQASTLVATAQQHRQVIAAKRSASRCGAHLLVAVRPDTALLPIIAKPRVWQLGPWQTAADWAATALPDHTPDHGASDLARWCILAPDPTAWCRPWADTTPLHCSADTLGDLDQYHTTPTAHTANEQTRAAAIDALDRLDPAQLEHADWWRCLVSAYISGVDQQTLAVWTERSAARPGVNLNGRLQTVARIHNHRTTHIGPGTLHWYATQHAAPPTLTPDPDLLPCGRRLYWLDQPVHA